MPESSPSYSDVCRIRRYSGVNNEVDTCASGCTLGHSSSCASPGVSLASPLSSPTTARKKRGAGLDELHSTASTSHCDGVYPGEMSTRLEHVDTVRTGLQGLDLSVSASEGDWIRIARRTRKREGEKGGSAALSGSRGALTCASGAISSRDATGTFASHVKTVLEGGSAVHTHMSNDGNSKSTIVVHRVPLAEPYRILGAKDVLKELVRVPKIPVTGLVSFLFGFGAGWISFGPPSVVTKCLLTNNSQAYRDVCVPVTPIAVGYGRGATLLRVTLKLAKLAALLLFFRNFLRSRVVGVRPVSHLVRGESLPFLMLPPSRPRSQSVDDGYTKGQKDGRRNPWSQLFSRNVVGITGSSHAGTHADQPVHFLPPSSYRVAVASSSPSRRTRRALDNNTSPVANTSQDERGENNNNNNSWTSPTFEFLWAASPSSPRILSPTRQRREARKTRLEHDRDIVMSGSPQTAAASSPSRRSLAGDNASSPPPPPPPPPPFPLEHYCGSLLVIDVSDLIEDQWRRAFCSHHQRGRGRGRGGRTGVAAFSEEVEDTFGVSVVSRRPFFGFGEGATRSSAPSPPPHERDYDADDDNDSYDPYGIISGDALAITESIVRKAFGLGANIKTCPPRVGTTSSHENAGTPSHVSGSGGELSINSSGHTHSGNDGVPHVPVDPMGAPSPTAEVHPYSPRGGGNGARSPHGGTETDTAKNEGGNKREKETAHSAAEPSMGSCGLELDTVYRVLFVTRRREADRVFSQSGSQYTRGAQGPCSIYSEPFFPSPPHQQTPLRGECSGEVDTGITRYSSSFSSAWGEAFFGGYGYRKNTFSAAAAKRARRACADHIGKAKRHLCDYDACEKVFESHECYPAYTEAGRSTSFLTAGAAELLAQLLPNLILVVIDGPAMCRPLWSSPSSSSSPSFQKQQHSSGVVKESSPMSPAFTPPHSPSGPSSNKSVLTDSSSPQCALYKYGIAVLENVNVEPILRLMGGGVVGRRRLREQALMTKRSEIKSHPANRHRMHGESAREGGLRDYSLSSGHDGLTVPDSYSEPTARRILRDSGDLLLFGGGDSDETISRDEQKLPPDEEASGSREKESSSSRFAMGVIMTIFTEQQNFVDAKGCSLIFFPSVD